MIAIRVDSNQVIATGHLMRCMSIADILSAKGIDVLFIISDNNSVSLLETRGFNYHILDTDYSNLMKETDSIINVIKKNDIRVMLVDSYYATDEYYGVVSAYVKVVTFDDMQVMYKNVAGVVQYSPFVDKKKYADYYIGTDTKLITGAEYAPLRSEFSNINYGVQDKVTDIMITTGGTDQFKVAYNLVNLLINDYADELCGIKFHMVIGSMYSDIEKYDELSCESENIILHKNTPSMSAVMRECDIAVSAGGTTLLELSACGIPSVVFAVADNQCDWVNKMIEQGYMLGVGDIRCSNVEALAKQLINLVKDANMRRKLSTNMRRLCDGHGASRIASELHAMDI